MYEAKYHLYDWRCDKFIERKIFKRDTEGFKAIPVQINLPIDLKRFRKKSDSEEEKTENKQEQPDVVIDPIPLP